MSVPLCPSLILIPRTFTLAVLRIVRQNTCSTFSTDVLSIDERVEQIELTALGLLRVA